MKPFFCRTVRVVKSRISECELEDDGGRKWMQVCIENLLSCRILPTMPFLKAPNY